MINQVVAVISTIRKRGKRKDGNKSEGELKNKGREDTNRQDQQ